MLKPFWFQTLSSVSRYFWKNIYNVTLLRRQFWFWIILLFKAWDISFSQSYASKGKKGIEFSRVLCKFKEKNVLFSLKENWAYSISDPSLYKNHGGWKYYYKIAARQLKLIHIFQREEISRVMIFMLYSYCRKFRFWIEL